MIYRNGVVANPESCGETACSEICPLTRLAAGTIGTIRADTGVCPYDRLFPQLPRCKVTSPAYVHSVDDPYFVLAGLPTERGS